MWRFLYYSGSISVVLCTRLNIPDHLGIYHNKSTKLHEVGSRFYSNLIVNLFRSYRPSLLLIARFSAREATTCRGRPRSSRWRARHPRIPDSCPSPARREGRAWTRTTHPRSRTIRVRDQGWVVHFFGCADFSCCLRCCAGGRSTALRRDVEPEVLGRRTSRARSLELQDRGLGHGGRARQGCRAVAVGGEVSPRSAVPSTPSTSGSECPSCSR